MARSFQASKTSIDKVKQAFELKGWTQDDLAGSVQCARSTVSKFFAGKSVDKDIFQKICSELDLKWEEIVDWDRGEVASQDTDSSTANCDTMTQLTTPGGSTEENQQSAQKVAIAMTGTVAKVDLPQIKALLALLQKKTGDFSIEIVDIEEGSVRLILEGSQAGLEQIETLFNSGQLSEVLGIPVLDAQFLTAKDSEHDKKRLVFTIDANISPEDLRAVKAVLTKASDSNEEIKTDKKSRLVQEILSQGARGRDLRGTDLSDANLSGASLSRADLRDADLRGAYLFGAYLSYANLRGADLRGADLIGAYLSYANLSDANLRGAYLFGAYLSDADLRGADLRGANLSRADLSFADLSFAKLRGADLSDTNLSGTKVKNARFEGNLGITEQMKQDLIKRGAIFNDSPGDRSKSLVPR